MKNEELLKSNFHGIHLIHGQEFAISFCHRRIRMSLSSLGLSRARQSPER